MPTEQEIYADHAREYEALISHEDRQGNILNAILEIVPLEGKVALDLGAGTGRLAILLARHVRALLAFDVSTSMLEIAHEKLSRLEHVHWLAAAADHRSLPLLPRSADLIVSGWSVSYVALRNPEGWREQVESWLAEASRVLRPGGIAILLESLGTGVESPHRLPHLEGFYDWLDERGFSKKWIRTDYEFESAQLADRLTGFFFGVEMKQQLRRGRTAILPECTGVWWRQFQLARRFEAPGAI